VSDRPITFSIAFDSNETRASAEALARELDEQFRSFPSASVKISGTFPPDIREAHDELIVQIDAKKSMVWRPLFPNSSVAMPRHDLQSLQKAELLRFPKTLAR